MPAAQHTQLQSRPVAVTTIEWFAELVWHHATWQVTILLYTVS